MELILNSSTMSGVYPCVGRYHDIVIGVPHHAPAGTPRLPCPDHPDADENAGHIGIRIARQLECCSVIACNSTTDANKTLHNEYSDHIAKWSPKFLIEIHGHGMKQTANDVEISCGSESKTKHSEFIADKLAEMINEDAEFGDISICGRFSEIYFKATKAVTINDSRWFSYHIELSPRLRMPAEGRIGTPSHYAYKFCDSLVEVLKKLRSNQ
jgi:hypothetical protein